MSKLDKVIGVQGNDEYNEGFNAGINFVKTVIGSKEFHEKLINSMVKAEVLDDFFTTAHVIKTMKEFNL